MAKHLPGKVARLLSDFFTIGELIRLIEHEMEKRIVARHALVKLDALLNLGGRLKNEFRGAFPANRRKEVENLEGLLARLRTDLSDSHLEVGRDALIAHSLQLDLQRLVCTWMFMGETTFGVLASDLRKIDAEFRRLSSAHPRVVPYPGAAALIVEPEWQAIWRDEDCLGDPSRPRLANIYPGLATAGVVSPIPSGNAAQDATIRASGLATFLRQVRQMLQAVGRGSEWSACSPR